MLTGKGLLTPLQAAFLQVFTGVPDQGRFYLTGGTALAEFYLGHRLSFDLALFTSEGGLILPISYQLEKACQESDLNVMVTRRFASYVELLVSRENEQLKVDLALDSPFRFLPPLLAESGVMVNDFQDIKVDKLLAYFGRAEPRDAIDLFFLWQQESIHNLMDLAAQKDTGFDLYWFAIALNRAQSFPDEIERWPVKMLLPCNPVLLKRVFQELADDLMRNLTH